MTKREFMLQATLNAFRGFGTQTDRIGGEYIVRSAEAAWSELNKLCPDDGKITLPKVES